LARRLWADIRFWRGAVVVLATTALALLVAALVVPAPPDFAERAVIAVLRASDQHPLWTLRLGRAAHQIEIDSQAPPRPPAGKDYQLWLAAPSAATPQPLGLLPLSGRKILAETPANIRRLAIGDGELQVTLEPATGSLAGAPGGPPVSSARLEKHD
jgi:anti-sigma-K factor RskA